MGLDILDLILIIIITVSLVSISSNMHSIAQDIHKLVDMQIQLQSISLGYNITDNPTKN